MLLQGDEIGEKERKKIEKGGDEKGENERKGTR